MARLTLALCLLLVPLGASAQDDEATQARALFEQGIEAYDGGDAQMAERLFRESIALRRSGSALFNLATLLEREGGDLVEALRLYEEVAEMSDVPEDVIRYSRERMADLAPRLAELVEQPSETTTTTTTTTIVTASGPDLVGPAVLLAAGGAVLLGGVATGIATAVLHGELMSACDTDGDCTQSRIDTGRALALTTDILLPVGGTVAAVGLVWLIVALAEGGDDAEVACRGGACGPRLRF